MQEHIVELKESDAHGRAYIAVEGDTQAEMTYSIAGDKLIIIDHTAVDKSLRGQGVGRLLLDTIIKRAKEQGKKIMPLCPYAKSVFDKDESIRDILINS